MKIRYRYYAFIALMCAGAIKVSARNEALKENENAFFETEEARRVGDQLLMFQRKTGGWPKNTEMCRPLSEEQKAKVMADKERRDDSTIDNNATITQLRYIARLYQATGNSVYKDSFEKGIRFLLSGQYADGGWPQFWPDMRGYQIHITYNDNAMYNVLDLFRRILKGEAAYGNGLLDKELSDSVRASYDKGIECILATQIRVGGKPTVWCQQHDRETYAPAKARSYELPSFCSAESAGLVRLLMRIPDPDERIKASVNGAMEWFEDHKLTGIRVERIGKKGEPGCDTRVVADKNAGPIWARYYDLESHRPFFCDRDGVPRERLSDIGEERRNGYGWYSDNPAALYPLYDEWKRKYCD